MNDYNLCWFKTDNTNQKLPLAPGITHIIHEDHVKFIKKELELGTRNGQKCLVLTHHAPAFSCFSG
eukprot:UN03003